MGLCKSPLLDDPGGGVALRIVGEKQQDIEFHLGQPVFFADRIIKKRAFTKSHVSMSVRSLEERGLLTGEYYGTDRRTIHLKLTDAAAPMVSDGKNVQKRAAEIICRGFTPEEHRMLFELMNRINSNISDYRKEGKLHEQQ